ncbi:MAG: YigZ family protein [Gammaproteobacteria bacterium]|nr:YigZ family protein [Gammaproteobacteria bacterium]
MTFLESVDHHSASPNCRARRPGQKYRFSDDGEPGGSAGQPQPRPQPPELPVETSQRRCAGYLATADPTNRRPLFH